MITCAECIERMRPDDPHIRAGKYRLCGCDFCDKPTYFRELEDDSQPQEQIVVHRHSDMSRQDFSKLQQVILKVDHLEKRLNERKPSKKVFNRYIP